MSLNIAKSGFRRHVEAAAGGLIIAQDCLKELLYRMNASWPMSVDEPEWKQDAGMLDYTEYQS